MTQFAKSFVVVLCVLLMSVALVSGAYAQEAASPAQVQSFEQALIDAGLVTPINMTETENDASVTLDWAYVDPLRITLQFTSVNIDMTVLTMSLNRALQLTDSEGNVFGYQSLQMTPPTDGNTRTTMVINYYTSAFNPDTSIYIEDYFADRPDDSIELVFSAQIGGFPLEAWDIAMLPADSELNEGETLPLVGNFQFTFSAPVQPAQVVEVNEQVNAADLGVTLNTMMVTPTQIAVDVCAELPDGGDWQPQVSLAVDGVPSRPMGWGLSSMPTEQDTARCFDLTFDALVLPTTSEIEFSILSMERGMNESGSDWQQIQPLMAALGFDYEVVVESGQNGGGGLRLEPTTIYDQPGFLDAVREARVQAGLIYEGPWVFNVDID